MCPSSVSNVVHYLRQSAVLLSDGLLSMVWCKCQGSVQILYTVTDIKHAVPRTVLQDSRLNEIR